MVKYFCFLAFLICFPTSLCSQNNIPKVTNVTFAQRTDGTHKVDIYYDLFDADGDAMTVSIEVSDDAGQTYNFTATLLTGDIGEGINSGTGKHIVWDFGSEHPDYFSDQIKIKIIADDGVAEDGGIPCPGIPTVTYAGKTYNTVQIGEQCWLKENLDVGTMIESNSADDNQTDNGIIEKYCYYNDPANCNTYGGLYQWDEAMQYVNDEGGQGICPNGWHLPTYTEFLTLSEEVNGDGNALKEIGQGTDGGAGTNESGFSALLAGNRFNNNGEFGGVGDGAYFRISTEINNFSTYGMSLHNYQSVVHFDNHGKGTGVSVRCVKD